MCHVYAQFTVFGRPFVKRFALYYGTVVLCVCLSVCLSVCNVGVLWQTVGWIKMPLRTEIGLGPGDIVLDEDPAPLRKGAQQPHSPHFSAHVYPRQIAANSFGQNVSLHRVADRTSV